MSLSPTNYLKCLHAKCDKIQTLEKVGKVVQVAGLLIESHGPDVPVGHIVSIESDQQDFSILGEVVGFRDNKVLLMPLEEINNVHNGCKVIALSEQSLSPVGEGLIGRVVDGLGKALDAKGPIRADHASSVFHPPPSPMKRRAIDTVFETGVKAIDTFVPIGCGQRIGIFSGSGVGKSTLLGMIAKGGAADVNVIALIGERGRELKEFIEHELGEEGMKKSVVVVSTSDQSPALRLRAAFLATRIAEDFRDKGKNVLLLMDSVTRLAMAKREIGLSVGEPPASRGYTPSVFSLLPKLLERSGAGEKGYITAIYTVLVEGDDLNEPVADTVRGILDGHIVLSRQLAVLNHFPAIDVLESISRLARILLNSEALNLSYQARDLMALYRKNEDIITIGAYQKGSHAAVDKAIDKQPKLMQFLNQEPDKSYAKEESWSLLQTTLE
jgi:flagellum-specific ATP synthase